MDNLYDHLGKTIACSALAPSGPTEIEAVIAPNPRRADLRHEPDPARDAERERLGLLGRIASVGCLLELYSGALVGTKGALCVGIVDASELPRDRSTLLVRFIAAGRSIYTSARSGRSPEVPVRVTGAHDGRLLRLVRLDNEPRHGHRPGYREHAHLRTW